MSLMASELTKIRSTRLAGVAAAAGIGLSVVVTGLLGLAMGNREEYCAAPGAACRNPGFDLDGTVVTAGVLGDGVPGAGLSALMLFGALVLLVEYRHRTLATTFMVTPARWPVMAAKAGVVAGFAFVVGGLATLASGIVFDLVGGPAAAGIDPWSPAAFGVAVRTALVAAVAALFALAVAALVRSALVAAAVVVLWPALVEPLLPSLLPGLGERLAGYLPFVNARAFVGLSDGVALPWGPVAAGAWFLAVVLVLLAVATAVITRRNLVATAA